MMESKILVLGVFKAKAFDSKIPLNFWLVQGENFQTILKAKKSDFF